MRRRPFIPESPGPLEGRTLLSGGASAFQRPVVASGIRLGVDLGRIRADFEEYAIGGNFPRLKYKLHQVLELVPFGRADGLDRDAAALLAQMRTNLKTGAPRPIASAYDALLAEIAAGLRRHLADGSLVIR